MATAFQAPNDYSVEADQISRQRKYAELLREQSMQPMETNQMAGGWVVPFSPFQGLAKLGQAYFGKQGEVKADERTKALAEALKTQGQGDVTNFVQALRGIPAQQFPTQANEMGDEAATQTVPAVAPNRDRALEIAMNSRNPMVAGAGGPLLAAMMPKENEYGTTPHFDQNGNAYVTDKSGNVKMLPNVKQPGVSSDTQAKLAQSAQQWGDLSANQRMQAQFEAAKLGISVQELMLNRARTANQGIETQFNTGMGGGVPNLQIPQIPQVPAAGAPQGMPPQAPQMPPQGARPPMQPSMAPQGGMPRPVAPQGGMTGATQQKLLLQRAEMEGKRDFNMGGLNSSLDEAERILKGQGASINGVPTAQPKPTNSTVGSLVDSAAGVFGIAPKGAAQADQLKSIGGALVAKMPRMEGPQSDKDVMLYREMAGRIGDDTIPISRRLEALQTVRQLYGKYEKGAAVSGAPGGWKDL